MQSAHWKLFYWMGRHLGVRTIVRGWYSRRSIQQMTDFAALPLSTNSTELWFFNGTVSVWLFWVLFTVAIVCVCVGSHVCVCVCVCMCVCVCNYNNTTTQLNSNWIVLNTTTTTVSDKQQVLLPSIIPAWQPSSLSSFSLCLVPCICASWSLCGSLRSGCSLCPSPSACQPYDRHWQLYASQPYSCE